jgi:hypothetical protein
MPTQNSERDENDTRKIQALLKTDLSALFNEQEQLENFLEDEGLGGEITEDDFRGVPKTFSDRLGLALKDRFARVGPDLKGIDRLRVLSDILLTEANKNKDK